MKNKKSLAIYFLVIVLLVVLTYGLRSTFAFFIANQKGVATDSKVAKLTYTLASNDLIDNSLTLKPYEIKKISINLTNDYDLATIYRLNYEGEVTVEKSSLSSAETKGLIDSKATSVIDVVITNTTDKEQLVKFIADGGYIGNDLEDGNITSVYDESLLQNKLLIDGTLTLTKEGEYRDLVGLNNYVKVDDSVYRIIGAFRFDDVNYLKLITQDSIGMQLFGDNNNYLTSSLNTYLNLDYKNSLNPIIKDNIKEVTYYTSGVDTILDNPQEYYNYERGSLIASEGFNKDGLSMVGLMYLSDYVYAENWIKKAYNEITIVPNVQDITKIYCVNYREEKKIENDQEIVVPINEISNECLVNNENNVRPVFYLDNKLVIEKGIGTLEDPYIVKNIEI